MRQLRQADLGPIRVSTAIENTRQNVSPATDTRVRTLSSQRSTRRTPRLPVASVSTISVTDQYSVSSGLPGRWRSPRSPVTSRATPARTATGRRIAGPPSGPARRSAARRKPRSAAATSNSPVGEAHTVLIPRRASSPKHFPCGCGVDINAQRAKGALVRSVTDFVQIGQQQAARLASSSWSEPTEWPPSRYS